MRYFLGIDVGSSKTHALIVNELGMCVGFGQAGGGNHQAVGYDGHESVLRDSFRAALKRSGVDKADIAGAGFGVAGYDFPSDRDAHLQAIAKLGLSCRVEVVNDGVNGLLAGAANGIGVNVTAGSSNNCRGRNKNGKEGRVVGNGATFGENGGAMEIVLKAIEKVNHAWIRRIAPTKLTNILLKSTGAKTEMDLVEGISNGQYHLSPYLAKEVFKAAFEGDDAARDIIHWAGEELGWLAISVARQIEMQDEVVEIIQSGSVFEAGEIIINPMQDIVLKHLPKAKLIRLDGPPVVGAVILGMEQAQFNGYAVRGKMVRTTKEIVR
jgi:N-acetylglucosamine kinase-like BadF-type ATPase